jgi:hypothetical protein
LFDAASGTSRHFAATQDVCRFRSEDALNRLAGPTHNQRVRAREKSLNFFAQATKNGQLAR